MKSLCLVLLLALSIPGCSMFTKSGRQDRAYYRQLKIMQAARQKNKRPKVIKQRADLPMLRPSPLQETVTTSEGQ
ncbi:MAG: hypothetical protein DLM73_03740 [Chthoniobacterales bacterium]|nr:MAG: hypothetical protein DLM73_03740 [Chthoniobacterales bacterium]